MSEKRGDEENNLESGIAFIFTGELEVLRINVAGKRIDIDIKDKQFWKRVQRLPREFSQKNQETTEKKEKRLGSTAMIRTTAEMSKKLGITVILSYKGHQIATLGTDANPTLLHFVTKTRALAINNVFGMIKLMI